MNNSFIDPSGVEYIIAADRQLSAAEVQSAVENWIASEKKRIFDNWKVEKRNKDWSGDAAAKTEELYAASRRISSKTVFMSLKP